MGLADKAAPDRQAVTFRNNHRLGKSVTIAIMVVMVVMVIPTLWHDHTARHDDCHDYQ